MKPYILLFILLSFNPNVAMGFGIMYNFFTSLFNPGKNDNNSKGQGGSNNEPSIPNPVPILNANLSTNVCGPHILDCPLTRYRSINGSCNNLENPGWGTPKSTYLRLLKNNYSDGKFKLPKSNTGDNLPNPRELSIKLFKDRKTNDKHLNLNAMQWGQILTHDMSKLQSASGEDGESLTCCENGKLTSEFLTNKFCAPVIVPYNDPIHKPGSCLDFVRADTDRHIGCVHEDQEANQLTMVTPFLDASMTYGSTDEQSAKVRAFENGNLKTFTRHGREWPPQAKDVTQTCSGAESPKEPCYVGGDTRINQNIELTVLQILTVHFHNFVADCLSQLNPHWYDERTFQEARRIVIAAFQNIHYYDYLSNILGRKHMIENKLIYPRTKDNMGKYINDYDPKLVPGIINEHATVALRYFHTLIEGYLEMKFEDRTGAGKLRLSDWFNRPSVLEKNDTFERLVVGLTAQPSSVADPFFTVEITEYLFRGKNKHGDDLRTTDIQRNRDMGLGSYQAARAACNLTVPKSWKDLQGIIPDNIIKLLMEIYKDVSNIDLTVGGTLESHVPGSLAGPTFLCIMLAQFYRTRVADRFWYENGKDKEIAFTIDQLTSIRGITMASFLCASSEVGTMQRRAFEIIKPDNPVVSCDEIPSLNITLWKEVIELVEDEEYEGYEEKYETKS